MKGLLAEFYCVFFREKILSGRPAVFSGVIPEGKYSAGKIRNTEKSKDIMDSIA